ncbi:phosphoenolpyruvate synthase [Listeria fleischmannii 1991]|uniref:Rifampicin phosphotransferase n=2 Tax=Listeria fleischmannii TaxID=1069827 RepID=A0A2X3HAZ8_9LIST|nr:rifamycin-inactivating phosphotransferase [Listeria fleischmannii]EMG26728.1 phosphoenolpyruvate synthase [Listeria fleischmannii subsp. fleischmannii LU2006-1]KMT57933.1 phosphoenolpyruvate synthase [Listeria fleischmannii 1991]SQC68414.1 Phosphoenolpyruvate synthase [Listeria fleischmannii subsp. fleischmannii]
MNAFVINLQEINQAALSFVGGKAANLGELTQIKNLNVPEGFCVTTNVYQEIIHQSQEIQQTIAELSRMNSTQTEEIKQKSAKLQKLFLNETIPSEIQSEISIHLENYGADADYAVRSSATAEDLPGVSFAGQQDTFLNISGKEAILTHIKKCWASLFNERAILYRMQNGFSENEVQLAVVVQKMIPAEKSGVLFTADPISGDRLTTSIDASVGLGEALVSGQVQADVYQVKNGKVVSQNVAESRENPILSEENVLELTVLGREMERYFGYPVDVEWCFFDDAFYIVQCRPITTLFPLPENIHDEKRIYLSVGHQQMMTDPLLSLGMSVYTLTSFGERFIAGGRLFVDVLPRLLDENSRYMMLDTFDSEPLTKDALITLLKRGDYLDIMYDETKLLNQKKQKFMTFPETIKADVTIVKRLTEESEEALIHLKQDIKAYEGESLIDFIQQDILKVKGFLSQKETMQAIMAAMDSALWLNEKMFDWLGLVNVSDTLTKSLPDNITSEMGLALLDVADAIRPYPDIAAFLETTENKNFIDELSRFKGGEVVQKAIHDYLEIYGMRCPGEIDLTRTRWMEEPEVLIPMILTNLHHFKEGAHEEKHRKGELEALDKKEELINQLAKLPDGESKVSETRQAVDALRHFSGFREYPKYVMVTHYFVYKQALLKEAKKLVEKGVISEQKDIYFFTLDELKTIFQTEKMDKDVLYKRKAEYQLYDKLTPPRVMTADGEILTGSYHTSDFPKDALPGLAVSSGVVEGRARVISKMEDAKFYAGEILVTTFTDPSFTPLFVSAKGLVTEVGGLMTHGAVIAREYGLPAVVGVTSATELIKDGQMIRIDGTRGFVQIL